ncbi:hypothetical protein SRHO_G00309020 [Serrasalmus rhombeus]
MKQAVSKASEYMRTHAITAVKRVLAHAKRKKREAQSEVRSGKTPSKSMGGVFFLRMTVSKSNIKESQPPSPSEPVLSTFSSASDQKTGKNTISENSAQENYQLLQSGPVLSACSLASDQVKHVHRKEEKLGK